MSTTPPNQPPYPPSGDPNAPFDPTNVNDPRYDPSRDPRYDPRWQKAQQRFFRDQQRMADRQGRVQQRAAEAAWKAQARAQRDQWKMYWRAQRRTSLVGPILLIAIGIVFFLMYTGRIAPYGLFHWYAHWWPVLLIGFGLLRLGEWAIDRARTPAGVPMPPYSTGGGVIFLIVILAFMGISMHSMQWRMDNHGMNFFGVPGDGMSQFFGQKHEEEAVPVIRTIATGGTLSIASPRGDISVSGTSDDGKVHLSVHKQVFTNSDRLAADRLKSLDPTLDGDDNNLSLRVPTIEGGSADVTLLVPPTVHLLVNSTRGDARVSNMKTALAVTADNGEVEVVAITGTVQVHSNNRHHSVNVRNVNGDVAIDGAGNDVTLSDITGAANVHGDFFGGTSMQRVSGAVTYSSSRTDLSFTRLYGTLSIDRDDLEADQVVGPAMVQTRSRNVTLNRASGELKIVNNHGDVKVTAVPAIGNITIDNQNGSVEVGLPEKSKFDLHAETSDGDIRSDFGTDSSPEKGVLSTTVNGGGPQVRVTTSHGDVNLSRNSESPLVPPPPAPRLSGFGTVPNPPMPPAIPTLPDWTTGDAKQQAEQARQSAKEAVDQARQSLKEAQEKQRQADQLAKEAANKK